MIYLFLYLSLFYHACVDNTFFNVACKDTVGIEKAADTLLIPYQYAFMGREAVQGTDGIWHFRPRFDYSDHFWIKNIPSWMAAPLSFVVGGGLKMLADFFPEMRCRYAEIAKPQPICLHDVSYRQMGLFTENSISEELFIAQGLPRRPGDEDHLADEKGALEAIGTLLTKAKIFWWADCGTCLGAYRYGGVIPWDFDIDIAVLEPDFENVYQLLKTLDPDKYIVLDLSSRDRPMSLLHVALRHQLNKEIDVYFFRIDPQTKELAFILSQENHIFMPKSWKMREQPFKTPVKFEDVFPLKRAVFDGIPIFVPNQIARYLSRIYGENLDPAKKYNSATRQYEKDFSHPYWQRSFAH